MKKHENDINEKKIYKCPKCTKNSHLAKHSYQQALLLKRLCRSCAMKKWHIEKYGEKKDRIFTIKCPVCGKDKKHTWKNQSEKQFERVKKDLSKKLCKSCSNSIYYILPKNKFNTKPEREFKEILNKLKIDYIQGFKFGYKFYDFYIPKLNILVEIDGIYWHGKGLNIEELNSTQKRNRENDILKNNIAKKNNILLLRFWEGDINITNVINKLYGQQNTSNLE